MTKDSMCRPSGSCTLKAVSILPLAMSKATTSEPLAQYSLSSYQARRDVSRGSTPAINSSLTTVVSFPRKVEEVMVKPHLSMTYSLLSTGLAKRGPSKSHLGWACAVVNGRTRPGETVVVSNVFFNLVTHHISLKYIKNLWVQCNIEG